MKKITVILMSVLLLAVVSCNKAGSGDKAAGTDKPITLETEKQKASYAIGFNVGNSLKEVLPELDFEILVQAMRDTQKEGKAQMTVPEMQKTFQSFNQKVRKKLDAKKKIQGEKNIEEGKKFLEENAKKEGVKSTESGLQYVVEKEGDGPMPKATDQVQVHYKGTLLDGTEFDSSYKRNEPAKFPLNRVIKGWTEGLQLMKVGSKFKFFIPSSLAYGERGSRTIGPNAVLIFDIELLSIEPPAAMKPKVDPHAGHNHGKPAPKPVKK
jgi:FKBP-type peptidyl-prolyl cis-trans isomerase